MTEPPPANIAELVCERNARVTPEATAVIEDRGEKEARTVSFSELESRTEEAAVALTRLDVGPREPVAIYLPQGADFLAWTFAALRLGAIAMPLARVLGPDGLERSLRHSRTRVIVTDSEGSDRLPETTDSTALARVLVDDGVLPLSSDPPHVTVQRDDPAFLFYTSGTSGAPKGVVLAHRMLRAQVPGFERVFELAPQPGDVYWTPSEWSWLGGLQVILVALYFGHPVVASTTRFSPESAYQLLSRHKVSCAFLAPAALRRMRSEPPESGMSFSLRAIMTGGETYSPEILEWARRAFACPVNDDYGLTEANDLAVSCAALFATPDGAAGRPVPGRRIAVISEDGRELPPLAAGEIAVSADDPVCMLGYWNGLACEPASHGVGEWYRTGDLGHFDLEGFLYVHGRLDDLILVSGYRVGPGEVEAELLTHAAVADAGVVGIDRPDGAGTTVGACIVLRPGVSAAPQLVGELQQLVKERLAAYAYPRRIVFVDELPTSTTGKIRREVLRRLLEAAEENRAGDAASQSRWWQEIRGGVGIPAAADEMEGRRVGRPE